MIFQRMENFMDTFSFTSFHFALNTERVLYGRRTWQEYTLGFPAKWFYGGNMGFLTITKNKLIGKSWRWDEGTDFIFTAHKIRFFYILKMQLKIRLEKNSYSNYFLWWTRNLKNIRKCLGLSLNNFHFRATCCFSSHLRFSENLVKTKVYLTVDYALLVRILIFRTLILRNLRQIPNSVQSQKLNPDFKVKNTRKNLLRLPSVVRKNFSSQTHWKNCIKIQKLSSFSKQKTKKTFPKTSLNEIKSIKVLFSSLSHSHPKIHQEETGNKY